MKNKQAELIKELTDRELLYNLLYTQIILLTISFFLGIILFDSYSSFFDLFHVTDPDIWIIGVPAGIAVVYLDLLMMKWVPAHCFDDGGVNERIFSSLSYPMIPIMTFLVAFSEEVLFRGVLQTHIGLFWASLVFAAVHIRYLHNWFLFLNIVILSFFVGFLFEWTGNLAVTITAHFLIDLLLGLHIKRKSRGKNLN
ncbi:CPBP family intramembrane glutamic endopeptidase [Bacillus massiliglaciei]|uniref:CPBP family intramembrane glutamic endopeptidase n=1 Tax=Bacillus massiliglaciei TaxID=1816693 RepID=UPI000ADFB865|nr:CPBP family intramembrane glutamic endopeptidase [Bacillus massiliglaciei]